MELPPILTLSAAARKGTLPEALKTEVNSGWHTHRFLNDLTFLGRTI
jgi:hypothetical protein